MSGVEEKVVVLTESQCARMKELARELSETADKRRESAQSYRVMIDCYKRLNEIAEEEGKPPPYQKKLEEALKYLEILEEIEDDIKRLEPIMHQDSGSAFIIMPAGGYGYYVKSTFNDGKPAWRIFRKRIVSEDDGSGLIQATQSYECSTNSTRID